MNRVACAIAFTFLMMGGLIVTPSEPLVTPVEAQGGDEEEHPWVYFRGNEPAFGYVAMEGPSDGNGKGHIRAAVYHDGLNRMDWGIESELVKAPVSVGAARLTSDDTAYPRPAFVGGLMGGAPTARSLHMFEGPDADYDLFRTYSNVEMSTMADGEHASYDIRMHNDGNSRALTITAWSRGDDWPTASRTRSLIADIPMERRIDHIDAWKAPGSSSDKLKIVVSSSDPVTGNASATLYRVFLDSTDFVLRSEASFKAVHPGKFFSSYVGNNSTIESRALMLSEDDLVLLATNEFMTLYTRYHRYTTTFDGEQWASQSYSPFYEGREGIGASIARIDDPEIFDRRKDLDGNTIDRGDAIVAYPYFDLFGNLTLGYLAFPLDTSWDIQGDDLRPIRVGTLYKPPVELPAEARIEHLEIVTDSFRDFFIDTISETQPAYLHYNKTVISLVGSANTTTHNFGFDATMVIGEKFSITFPYDEGKDSIVVRGERIPLDKVTPLQERWREPREAGETSFAVAPLPAFRPGNFARFTGDTDYWTASETPVVLMGAPPITDGLGQSPPTVPVLVSTQSNATIQGSSLQHRAGGIVGFEKSGDGPVPGLAFGDAVEARLGAEWGTEKTTTVSQADGVAFYGGIDEDYLGLTAIDVRTRVFDVARSSFSTEPHKLRVDDPTGVTSSRSIPLDEWLNPAYGAARNFDFSGLTSHTPGNVSTYPGPKWRPEECDYIKTGSSYDAKEGNSAGVSPQFTLSKDEEEVKSSAITHDREYVATIFGVSFGGYYGLTKGSSHGLSAGTSTFFTTATGNIPGHYNGTEEYKWGAVFCRATIQNTNPTALQASQIPLWFIGHWKDGYNGLGPMRPFVEISQQAPTQGQTTAMNADVHWEADWDERGTYIVEWEGLQTSESGLVRLEGSNQTIHQASLGTLSTSGALYRWRVIQERPDGLQSDPSPWNTFRPVTTPDPVENVHAFVQNDGAVVVGFSEALYSQGMTYAVDVTHQNGTTATARHIVHGGPVVIRGLAPSTYHVEVRAQIPGPNGQDLVSEPSLATVDTTQQLRVIADDWTPIAGNTVRVMLVSSGGLTNPQLTGGPTITRPDSQDPWLFDVAFAKPGPTTLTAKANNTDGSQVQVTLSMNVANRAPSISGAYQPGGIETGSKVPVTIAAHDADGDDLTIRFDPQPETFENDVATYQFATPGEHRICATVSDTRNGMDSWCALIDVANSPPQADWNASKIPIDLKSRSLFALRSEATDDLQVVRVLWEFGDGHVSEAPAPTHQYRDPGTYAICLTAWDEAGASDRQCHTIEVANRPPIASVSGPSSAAKDELVRFESLSIDDDGDIEELSWRAIGPATLAGGGTVWDVRFPHAGSYDVCVVARDHQGAENERCKSIRVTSKAPVVGITPSTWEPVIGVPLTFHSAFQASDGHIVSMAWTVNGALSGQATSLPFTFRTAGPHEVCLSVLDDQGASVQHCIVIDARPADAPLARWTQITDEPRAHQSVLFSDDSLMTERPIVERQWRVDGEPAGTAATLAWTFDAPGAHQVCLEVRDDLGGSHEACDSVAVWPHEPPVAGLVRTTDDPLTVEPTRFVDQSRPGDGDIIDQAWFLDNALVNYGLDHRQLFDSPGVHTMCRGVLDEWYTRADACLDFAVRDPERPNADWSLQTEDPMLREPVVFHDESMPAEAVITGRQWLIDDAPVGTEETLSYEFADSGSYRVCVQAFDEWERAGERCRTVAVRDPVGPAVSWSAMPAVPITLEPTFLTASVTAGDAPVVAVNWTIDGVEYASGVETEHTFDRPGPHQICVDVVDEYALTDQSCGVLIVQNRAPVANVTVDRFNLQTEEELIVLATSHDPDGWIDRLQWYVNGERFGADEDGHLRFTVRLCGHLDVRLDVWDDFGAMNTTETRIHAWDVWVDQPGTTIDSVTADAGPVYSIDQPIQPVHVPPIQHGICDNHDPIMVTGQHSHGT